MDKPDIDPVVAEFNAKAREALGENLLAVYWFGSRVRGEASGGSDYDLLLETRRRLTEEDRDRVADIAIDITAERGVLLDIHQRTSAAMSREHPYSVFAHSVKEEAVRV